MHKYDLRELLMLVDMVNDELRNRPLRHLHGELVTHLPSNGDYRAECQYQRYFHFHIRTSRYNILIEYNDTELMFWPTSSGIREFQALRSFNIVDPEFAKQAAIWLCDYYG